MGDTLVGLAFGVPNPPRSCFTSSYQASFQAFAARGVRGSEAIELMRSTVTIAREAADAVNREEAGLPPRRLLVAASVGCYGAASAAAFNSSIPPTSHGHSRQ